MPRKGECRSSDNAFSLIKWDPRYNIKDFSVGYLDRFKGILYVPMKDFNAGGDETVSIPMHRVYKIKHIASDVIVWDREKGIDELDNMAGTAVEEEEETDHSMVLENAAWGWRQLRPYVPSDRLEGWLLSVSHARFARECPTHISQRGAMYHVTAGLEDYLAAWEGSLAGADQAPFFVEEVRGSAFRLYCDLDVKLPRAAPYDPFSGGLIKAVLQHTRRFFSPLQASLGERLARVVVTQCHGPWSDKTNEEVKFKSGYRLFFTDLCVDAGVFKMWLLGLQRAVQLSSPPVTGLPDGLHLEEILDTKIIAWDRGRLHGTIKRRRNLDRRYTYAGCYTLTPLGDSAISDAATCGAVVLDEQLDALYRADTRAFLYATTLRLWDDDTRRSDGAPRTRGAAEHAGLQQRLVGKGDVDLDYVAALEAAPGPERSQGKSDSTPTSHAEGTRPQEDAAAA